MRSGEGLCVVLVDEHQIGADENEEKNRIEGCEDYRKQWRLADNFSIWFCDLLTKTFSFGSDQGVQKQLRTELSEQI